MKTSEYVQHLIDLAVEAEKGDDQERAQSTREVAEFTESIYKKCNGASLAAVFFALPLIGEIIHSSLVQYMEATADHVTDVASGENEFLWSLRNTLRDSIAHIDELAPAKPLEPMTDAEIEAMFESLPDDGKSDA